MDSPQLVSIIAFIFVVAITRILSQRPLTSRIASRLRTPQHPLFGPTVVFVLVMIAHFVPTLLGADPEPVFHDEIANLFVADTFLHGRLTNPTPPCWENFQTFHTLMIPSYASKFPPAPGAFLAIGKLLQLPVLGAFFPLALAGAAMCWAMQSVVPRHWAIIGALLASLHPHVFRVGGHMYWGAGPAFLGGALVLGAVLRAVGSTTSRNGVVLGVGLALLANSRPFEGLLFAMLAALWLSVEVSRLRVWGTLVRHTILPALTVLLPVACWMGYYNHRITGHAFVMPYMEHSRQYMRAPLFYWQSDQSPKPTGIAKMDGFRDREEYGEFHEADSWIGFWKGTWRKLSLIAWVSVLVPPVWVLLVIGCCWATQRREGAWLAVVLVLWVILHFCSTPYFRTHYMGPIAACFFGLLTMGLHRLSQKKFPGPIWTTACAVGAIASNIVILVYVFRQSTVEFAPAARAAFIRELEQTPGKHLVFVEYIPPLRTLYEPVHNSPDIESQRIVFAHELDGDRNLNLVRHFSDRTVWLFTVTDFEVRTGRVLLNTQSTEPR